MFAIVKTIANFWKQHACIFAQKVTNIIFSVFSFMLQYCSHVTLHTHTHIPSIIDVCTSKHTLYEFMSTC